MLDKPAKNNQVSWEVTQAFSAFLFYIVRPDIESILTLIALSLMLISLGISPLYIKSRSVAVATASCIMIALGSAIGGLTIATLLERLLTETQVEIKDSWVAGVALVCSSLAVLAWVFIVLKISPVSRPPLVAVVLFALAGVYSLIYGILTTEAVLSDVPRTTSEWEEGIAYILNGSAMVGWAFLVTQKTVINKRKKLFVICLLISGVSTILVGITHVFDAIF